MSAFSPRSKLAEQTNPPGHKPEIRPPANSQPRDGYLAVGVALTSFGLNGDIKVEPLTDFTERFEPGAIVWFGGRKRHVQRSRWQGRIVYLKLTGINSADAVVELRGQYLEVPEAERARLEPDEFYQSDVIGLEVETTAGRTLGRVIEFLPTGANDVLVVRGAGGEVLVPMIEDVVKEVDIPGGKLVIEPIEGLLPESPSSPRPPRVPTRGPAWRRRLAERAATGRPPSPPSDSAPDHAGVTPANSRANSEQSP